MVSDEDFLYSLPMLAVMYVRRFCRWMTRHRRRTTATVTYGVMPPPERQHIDGHKWSHVITISFDGPLPPLGWDQMNAFNDLLLATEMDRMLIGVNFVSIFTDTPQHYDPERLAQLACDAFGIEMIRYMLDPG